MSSPGHIASLAYADFLERSRRYSFLVTLGFVLYAAYLFLPPNHAQYSTLQMGGHRGIYNSAWVGTLVAMQTALFLSLAGFYLVKNTLQRDRESGVGHLLASSPLSNRGYVASKFVSNFLVLGSMVAVMVVAAGAMQLVRGEAGDLQPLTLAAPFVILTLPVMLVVAAMAVLFESVRTLRGGLGNVFYYFLWTALIIAGVPRPGAGGGWLDLIGLQAAIPDMLAACSRAFPDFDPTRGSFNLGFNIHVDGTAWNLQTFVWPGIRWTASIALHRLVWVGVAITFAWVAVRTFDRFDPARDGRRPRPGTAGSPEPVPPPNGPAANGNSLEFERSSAPLSVAHLPLDLGQRRPAPAPIRLARLVGAECQIAFAGVSRWWFIVAAGNVLACLLAPMEIVRALFFPFAWIWPLLFWSALGTREIRTGTEALIYSAPRPLLISLPASWCAGAMVAAATGMGMGLRLFAQGEWSALGAWLVGAAFIPALALALGSASGQSKLFEIVYLVLWYVGPLNKFPYLDFMGTSPEGAAGATWGFAAASAVCLAGAFVARWVRLRR